ncbi:disulfide bond formation protein DsbA [Actinoplanes sp. ATCC 53533]|uniref:DsbA family protein n=1 Tax=Actinoplanes sp. ATCC 53533 TaxID=1288362 RepID=UPI000F77A0C2|nr:thioredoxin domain-containing protein [Actinoplanes sp. ATCC 53533]RSM72704.1 disulfide bond formation protein DsbA [Actinoplanes sp. ATCC 53533]
MSGKNNRDRAKAKAKRIVQEQLAQERRRRITLWTSLGVVALLIAVGLIGWGVAAGQESDKTAGLTTPSVAVDDGTAFAIGTGPVTVDIYEDFMCPVCGQFETGAATTIDQLVAAKKVTVRYHPIAILDRASSTEYSTRSAAASAAAAQGGKFAEYHRALFANQPEEGSAGLDDAKLIELGKSAGLTDAAFADAVKDGTYKAWATKVTDTAASRGVNSTPTVLVAGKALEDRSAQGLTAAVEAAGA